MPTARHALFCFLAFMKPQGFPGHVPWPSQPRSRIWPAVLSLLLLIAIAWSHQGAAQQAQITQTPLAVQNGTAKLIAHYDPTQKLRLVFALKPPHMAEEEQFLNQLQDRDSPLFHKYLSEREWDQRFAPSAQDEQAVVDWAASQGLAITQRYGNRLLVDVEAPVAMIQQALQVVINRYRLGGREVFSNDRDPSIPVYLATTIHAILGLNSVEVAHPASRNIKQLPTRDYVPGPVYAVGPHVRGDGDRKKLETLQEGKAGKRSSHPDDDTNPYGPADIYASTAYDYSALSNLGHCCNPLNNPGNSPPEASIAVVIWNDFSDDDLSGFINTYPYLAYNVQRYFVDGTPKCCDPEATLDVEWSTATANSFASSADTAEIHVYEGVNNHDSTDLTGIFCTRGNERKSGTKELEHGWKETHGGADRRHVAAN